MLGFVQSEKEGRHNPPYTSTGGINTVRSPRLLQVASSLTDSKVVAKSWIGTRSADRRTTFIWACLSLRCADRAGCSPSLRQRATG
jgi:hypothetical protein